MPRPRAPKLVRTAQISSFANRNGTENLRQRERESSTASSGRVTNNTDDSDGLVIEKRSKGHGKPAQTKGIDLTMSGALAIEEFGSEGLRPISKSSMEDITRIVRDAEHKSHLATSTLPRKHILQETNDSQTDASSERPQGLPQGQIWNHARRPSALLQSRRPSLAARGPMTPLSLSSNLKATDLRKRVRQPSLLKLINHEATESNLDDTSGDFDDFQPDDESTPMVKSVSNQQVTETGPRSRKRKLKSPDVQVLASQSPPPTEPSARRSLQISSHSSEQSETVLLSHQNSPSPSSQILSDTLAPPESPCSSPPTPKNRPGDADGAMLANPGDSPNARPNPKASHKSATLRSSAKDRGKGNIKALSTEPLTTAVLQNLLPRRRTQQRMAKSSRDIANTDDFQSDSDEENLVEPDERGLGTRGAQQNKKRKSRTVSDAAKSKPGSGRTKTTDKSKASSKTRGRRRDTSEKKPATPTISSSKRTSTVNPQEKRISRTYSRKSVLQPQQEDSDHSASEIDENDEDSTFHAHQIPKATTSTAAGSRAKLGTVGLDNKAKAEMERLAKKFREVDNYALDFEDMTANSGSSQMRDAR